MRRIASIVSFSLGIRSLFLRLCGVEIRGHLMAIILFFSRSHDANVYLIRCHGTLRDTY